jgi:hypothetical protein
LYDIIQKKNWKEHIQVVCDMTLSKKSSSLEEEYDKEDSKEMERRGFIIL